MSSVRYALKALRSIKNVLEYKNLDELPPSIKKYAKMKEYSLKFQKILDEKKQLASLGDLGIVEEKYETKDIKTSRPIQDLINKDFIKEKVHKNKVKELKEKLVEQANNEGVERKLPELDIFEETIEKEEEIRKELEKEDIGPVSLESIQKFLDSSKEDYENVYKNNILLERMIQKLFREEKKKNSNQLNIPLYSLDKKDKLFEINQKLFYFTNEVVDQIKKLKFTKGKDIIEVIKKDVLKKIESSPHKDLFLKEFDSEFKNEELFEKCFLITQIPSPFEIISLLKNDNINNLKSMIVYDYLNIFNLNDSNFKKGMTFEMIISQFGKDYLINYFQNNFKSLNLLSENEIELDKDIQIPSIWKPVHEALLNKDFKLAIERKKEISIKELLDQVKDKKQKENWKEYFFKFEDSLKRITDFNLEKEVDLHVWKYKSKELIEKEGVYSIMKWDYVDQSLDLFRKHNISISLKPVNKMKKESKVPPYYLHYFEEITNPSDNHPLNRRVMIKSKVSNFGFSFKAMERFKNIVKHRYDQNSDLITLRSDLYKTKKLNEEYCVQLLLEIIKESKKVDQGELIQPDIKKPPINQLDIIKERLKSLEKEDLQSNNALAVWSKLTNAGQEYVGAKHTYGLFEKAEKKIFIEVSDEEFEKEQQK